MDMLAYLTLKEAMRLRPKAAEPFAFLPQMNGSPFVLRSYHHVMSVLSYFGYSNVCVAAS